MARNVTDPEIAAARARGAQMRAAGLAATSVAYDGGKRRIVLELANGNLFGIPVSALPNIAGATDADLETVELLGESVIHIESLDADYSVAGLVMSAFGTLAAAKSLGRAGGAATSSAKTESSRANGAKGGRPRRVMIAADTGRVVSVRTTSVTHSMEKNARDKEKHVPDKHRMVKSAAASTGRFTIKKASKPK
jgi:hypothetical protein